MKSEINRLSSRLIGIIVIWICVCVSAFSQQAIEATTRDGKSVLLKPDGTWEYKKTEQNPIDKNVIEVDLDDVALSPNDYKNKTILAKRVYIGNVESFIDGNNTYYFVEVRTQSKNLLFPSLSLNKSITFGLHESYVKSLTDYYKTTRKPSGESYLANLTAEVYKIEIPEGAYFIAKITCIEIVSAYNKTIFTLGQCS